ncbi:MAG: hypothetical protein ABL962_20325 [Fimbriimonadaceae bacterium]
MRLRKLFTALRKLFFELLELVLALRKLVFKLPRGFLDYGMDALVPLPSPWVYGTKPTSKQARGSANGQCKARGCGASLRLTRQKRPGDYEILKNLRYLANRCAMMIP